MHEFPLLFFLHLLLVLLFLSSSFAKKKQNPYGWTSINHAGKGGGKSTTHRQITFGGLTMTNKIFCILYGLQFFFIVGLLSYVIFRHVIFRLLINNTDSNNDELYSNYLFSLSTSLPCSTIVAFSWFHSIRCCNPSKTIKAAFCLSPSLTCAAGILLLLVGTTGSLTVAAIAIIFALIQSLYACWVVNGIDHTSKILSISQVVPSSGTTGFIIFTIVKGYFYSTTAVLVLCCAATNFRTGFSSNAIFVWATVISLAWLLQVYRNICHASISTIGYYYFSYGIEFGIYGAFLSMLLGGLKNVCLGSAIVPVIGIIRGWARAIRLVAGGNREGFFFSCVNYYADAAAKLVAYGNQLGFVHVGVNGTKGFIESSMKKWEMIGRAGMESVIDSDLTGSFCFLCAVASGAACTLVSGSFALAAVEMERIYVTQISIYAFFIGYFMCQIALALPQACVTGYYVAYAENPLSLLFEFDSTIPDRITELQHSRV